MGQRADDRPAELRAAPRTSPAGRTPRRAPRACRRPGGCPARRCRAVREWVAVALFSSAGRALGYDHALGREVGQVAAHVVEHGRVVGRDVVDHAAGQRDIRTAQVLLRDVLSRRLFDDRRAGGEDGALVAHDGEVADRRDQRAVSGRRAEHRGDGGDPARAAWSARSGRWGCVRSARRWAGIRRPRASSPAGSCRAPRVRRCGSAWSCRPGRCVPASVVKSSAPTITGAPSIRPEPMTMPSAATLPADQRAEFAESCPGRAGARCGRGRRACPCRGAWRPAPGRPSRERAARRRSRSSSVSCQSWAFVMHLSSGSNCACCQRRPPPTASALTILNCLL